MIGKILLIGVAIYIAATAAIIAVKYGRPTPPPGTITGEQVATARLIACRLKLSDRSPPVATMTAVVESGGQFHEFVVAEGQSVRVAGFEVDPILAVRTITVTQYNGGVRHEHFLKGTACR
jgi:hypothetical protein